MNVLYDCIVFLGRFATQYLAGLLLFFPLLKRRSKFLLRFIPSIIVYCVFPYAVSGFGLYRIYGNPYLYIGWVNLNWLAVFFVGILFLLVCFKVTFFESIYFGSVAYTMQHFVRRTAYVLRTMIEMNNWLKVISLVVICVIAYLIFYYAFVSRIKKYGELRIKNWSIVGMSFVTMLIVYLLSMFVSQKGESTKYSGDFYAIVCCFLLLVMQFGAVDMGNKKYEKIEIEKMLAAQQQLYRVSMETASIINVKCHDLKRQIGMLKTITEESEWENELRQVEKNIMIYDGIAKTENDCVNLVVSEKNMLCEKHGIHFSYMLEVDDLNFIDNINLYSLLSNALDNAIEESVKISDLQKRIISLRIQRMGDNVNIHIENYCESKVVLVDGLPVTSKGDKTVHGYGLKSISYIATKYNGAMRITLEGSMFILDINIPIPVTNN